MKAVETIKSVGKYIVPVTVSVVSTVWSVYKQEALIDKAVEKYINNINKGL